MTGTNWWEACAPVKEGQVDLQPPVAHGDPDFLVHVIEHREVAAIILPGAQHVTNLKSRTQAR